MSERCSQCPIRFQNEAVNSASTCPGPINFMTEVVEAVSLDGKPVLLASRAGESALTETCSRDVDMNDPSIIITDATSRHPARYGMIVGDSIAALDENAKQALGHACRDDFLRRMRKPAIRARKREALRDINAIAPTEQLWAEMHAVATEAEIPHRIQFGISVIEEAHSMFANVLKTSTYCEPILDKFNHARKQQQNVLQLEGDFKDRVFQYMRENQIASDRVALVASTRANMQGLNEWIKDHPALPELGGNDNTIYMNQVLRRLTIACDGLANGGFQHLQETILRQRQWWFSEATKDSGNQLVFEARAIIGAQQKQAEVAQKAVYAIFDHTKELINVWSRL